jgi:hypothetical protein
MMTNIEFILLAMMWNRLLNPHLLVGIIGVVVFLLTGQYMHWWHNHLYGMANTPRLLFRSTHIYLLWSSLLNMAIGLYIRQCTVKWCQNLQRVGSFAILLGPPLLIAAFFIEPWLLELVRPYARPAIYIAFGGTIAHAIAVIGDEVQVKSSLRSNGS